jgi:hypothetical protein
MPLPGCGLLQARSLVLGDPRLADMRPSSALQPGSRDGIALLLLSFMDQSQLMV